MPPAPKDILLSSRVPGLESLQRLALIDGRELLRFVAPGPQAAATWMRLRELRAETGLWPVMLGADSRENSHQAMAETLQGGRYGESVQKLIAEGEALDVDAWLAERRAEMAELLEGLEDDDGDEWAGSADELVNEFEEEVAASASGAGGAGAGGSGAGAAGGAAKVDPAKPNFTAPFDLGTGKPHARVAFALVPAEQPWHVPAWLNYGGWNECPSADAQVAFWKRWHERFGAEIAALAGDVAEGFVTRPPSDDAAALALAKEQCDFCSDIVYQGTGSVAELARGLKDAATWFFWWD